jgi:hypothetical protein
MIATTTSQQEIQEQENGKGTQEPQNDNNNYAPDFDEWIKEKPRHNYIRLEVNVPKVIGFKSARPYKKDTSDFNGKSKKGKIPVYTYAVTVPEEPNVEYDFDITSKRLGADIVAYYEKGFTELEITKLSTNPTSYRVIPLMARERQQGLAGKQRQ